MNFIPEDLLEVKLSIIKEFAESLHEAFDNHYIDVQKINDHVEYIENKLRKRHEKLVKRNVTNIIYEVSDAGER
jgi:hypothetical protein